ncbi:hypothetical protein DL93DRAFT_847159 [Clavulina sp. PMI_390]|nr:hypothetical protein DL93DRAFT_847159 [Clavulina sp. PMI_390]
MTRTSQSADAQAATENPKKKNIFGWRKTMGMRTYLQVSPMQSAFESTVILIKVLDDTRLSLLVRTGALFRILHFLDICARPCSCRGCRKKTLLVDRRLEAVNRSTKNAFLWLIHGSSTITKKYYCGVEMSWIETYQLDLGVELEIRNRVMGMTVMMR